MPDVPPAANPAEAEPVTPPVAAIGPTGRRRLLLLRRLISTALQLGTVADPLLRILAGAPVAAPVSVGVVANFSPQERAIVEAIGAAGEPLQGKEVAAQSGLPLTSDLKVLLRNLRDRGILAHVPGQGYTLARAELAEVTP